MSAIKQSQRGMTLIELMVGILISMLLSLAVFTVISVSESRKRTTTSTNDINQAGNYAIYLLDKLVRGAGSGFWEAADYAFGCKLLAAKGSNQLLPRVSALPAPFDDVNTGTANVFRLAPVLIAENQTKPTDSGKDSDVLFVMSSASGTAPVPVSFDDVPAEKELSFENTVNFTGGDLLLLADQVAPGVPSDCLVQQVAGGFAGGTAQKLPLNGRYYTAGVQGKGAASFGQKGMALQLGSLSQGNVPSFLLIGVGDHSTLYSYDLLETGSAPLVPIVDGVFELHALYGVDLNGDDKIDTWVTPSKSAEFSARALMDGSSAATQKLKQIKAVRVGLIMRTSVPEKDEVTHSEPKLFVDLGPTLEFRRDWRSDEEKHYRYRTIETTIPVRNALL